MVGVKAKAVKAFVFFLPFLQDPTLSPLTFSVFSVLSFSRVQPHYPSPSPEQIFSNTPTLSVSYYTFKAISCIRWCRLPSAKLSFWSSTNLALNIGCSLSEDDFVCASLILPNLSPLCHGVS